jgi:AraC family transcriptional regulator of adaptative response / DNA-3-methyladenine glycosylase II
VVDAISRLARAATHRIAEGALNSRDVGTLAAELLVSERHLRRCLAREAGVSPLELALTHRLLLAKRLLADTSLDVTRVAYASGFQSLRRFNATFRERYHMAPGALRKAAARRLGGPLRLTLSYRSPFAWERLLAFLARETMPGVEVIDDASYARTVRLAGCLGVVQVRNHPGQRCLAVEVSEELLPALMPVLARLRRLFDLDAEPVVVDQHLAEAGLAPLVNGEPGVRVPGAFDGFEVALATLLRRAAAPAAGHELVRRVVCSLGEPIDVGRAGLDRVAPSAERVADVCPTDLHALGVPPRLADALGRLARAVVQKELRLEPGSDPIATRRALEAIEKDDRFVTNVVMRSLCWPDAFPDRDSALRRAAGASTARELRRRAEIWRPWRSYAAMRLAGRARDTARR